MCERAPAAELTEEQMEEICERYGFSCRIFGNDVFVTTGFGKWIVRLKKGYVSELRHGNMHQRPSKDFEEVICYINNHDKNLVKRMTRKTKMEKLFEKIEKECEDLA